MMVLGMYLKKAATSKACGRICPGRPCLVGDPGVGWAGVWRETHPVDGRDCAHRFLCVGGTLGSLRVDGGSAIRGNRALQYAGGAVFVALAVGSVEVAGGSVTGNVAQEYGGGLSVPYAGCRRCVSLCRGCAR